MCRTPCCSQEFAVEWKKGQGPEEFCNNRVFNWRTSRYGRDAEESRSLSSGRDQTPSKLLFVGQTLFVGLLMQLLA